MGTEFSTNEFVGQRGTSYYESDPVPTLELFQHFRAGRHAEARELQRRITPLARMVTTEYGVPGLKAAMTMAGYRAGAPRLPLTPATGDALDQIRAALTALQVPAEALR